MSEQVDLEVGLDFDGGDAIKDAQRVADGFSAISEEIRDLTSALRPLAAQLSKAAGSVDTLAKAQKSTVSSSKEATSNLQAQAAAARELQKSLAGVGQRNVGQASIGNGGVTKVSTASTSGRPDIGVASRQDIESLNASNFAREQAIKIRQREQAAIRATIEASVAESRAWRELNAVKTQATQITGTYAGSAHEVAQRMSAAGFQAHAAAKGTQEFTDNLFTARYALHDISNATAIAGAALLAFNAYAVNAAADYETAMASIDRTTGATTSQMRLIRDEFTGLAQEIPAGFDNLAQIGELAGQLNVPTAQIASFTETVAQFTSSTDVTVSSAAEAFGRLDALLPDVQGNYNALGSAILNVGVNSVATESSIISTTTQIAAAGAQAGFTTDQIVGLAASFASLGIAPEAARGSTIRILSDIKSAVVEGGAALENFGAIAGMSGKDFEEAWNTNSSGAFLSFLGGLQREGANAETSLRSLGITGVRDINALLRLSQNLDVVTDSFGYANDGFTQGTQLAEAYGITSETLNSRVQVLGQALQALFAELGEGSTGPLKVLVDGLIDVLKFMTEIAKNPAAQWLAVFGGIFTILAGGILILTSLVARMGASAIAMQTVNTELRAMAANALATNTAMGSLQSRVIGAGISMTQFGNILKAIGWGTAITAGITVAMAGFQAITDALKTNGERAKDAFGDLTGLTAALQKDTAEVADGTQRSLGTVIGTMTTTTEQTANWVTQLETATGAQTSLASETDRAKESVDQFTYSIGENSAAWIANQLANNEAIKRLFQNNEALANQNLPTADTSGVISAAARNDTEAAKKIIADYQASIDQFLKDNRLTETSDNAQYVAMTQQLNDLKAALDITSGALSTSAAMGEITNSVNEALGISTDYAADATAGLGEESLSAADKMSALQQSIQDAFSGQNTIVAFGDAVYSLFQGIAETGSDAFNIIAGDGSGNLANLQTAIVQTISAGEVLGISASESVAVLFRELQKQGIDTANLLSSLAKIPGIGKSGVSEIKNYLGGTTALSSNAENLAKSLTGVAGAGTKAAKSIGGGGSKSTGGAAKKAAAEIRTLTDYANDLESVFKRAFDIRFGSMQGLDSIQTSWNGIREAIDKANQAIIEARANMATLNTENSKLEYFLGVANNYGDSLRAADITDQIAQNNAKLAEEQKKASDASAEMDKSLTGNSKSAIDNRADILGLVGQYQSLIATYAESGLDQAALAQKTAELRAQFIAQATQLGYNSAELDTYAVAFDDVSTAISRVPRNITVAANVNPAIQALNELESKARSVGASVGSSLAGGVSSGIGGIGGSLSYAANVLEAYGQYQNAIAQQVLATTRAALSVMNPAGMVGQLAIAAYWGGYARTLRGAYGFESGGYTGPGGTKDVAGVVHGKEYVVNAQNTARLGIPFLNALNSGRTPVAQGNTGQMSVVELSATDRALLAAAGNVQLSIGGQVVAQATNGANFVAAQRGSN